MGLGEGSDHLQVVKFWPLRAPGKGVCGGAKIFVSALLQPARNVCVSSERFFHCVLLKFFDKFLAVRLIDVVVCCAGLAINRLPVKLPAATILSSNRISKLFTRTRA